MDEVNHRQFSPGSQLEVYNVLVAGGWVDQVFTILAEFLKVRIDGNTILYHYKKEMKIIGASNIKKVYKRYLELWRRYRYALNDHYF